MVVTFQHVEIRDYPIILGNNPSTDYGPPIEIDWKYQNVHIHTIDEYELQRQKQRKPKSKQLYLSQVYRIWLLTEGQKVQPQQQNLQEQPPRVPSPTTINITRPTDDEINEAIRMKERDQLYRWIHNKLRYPNVVVEKEVRHWRRQKRIKRAIRNLTKKSKKSGNGNGNASNNNNVKDDGSNSSSNAKNKKNDDVYRGWWFPFSAYIL